MSLIMSSGDFFSVLWYMAAGAGFLGAYRIADLKLNQATHGDRLDAEYDVLQNDHRMFDALKDLEKLVEQTKHPRTKRSMKRSFREIVDNADKLVHRVLQLQDKKIEPSPRDTSECNIFTDNAIHTLDTLLQRGKHEEDKLVVMLENAYRRVHDLVLERQCAVTRMCTIML